MMLDRGILMLLTRRVMTSLFAAIMFASAICCGGYNAFGCVRYYQRTEQACDVAAGPPHLDYEEVTSYWRIFGSMLCFDQPVGGTSGVSLQMSRWEQIP